MRNCREGLSESIESVWTIEVVSDTVLGARTLPVVRMHADVTYASVEFHRDLVECHGRQGRVRFHRILLDGEVVSGASTMNQSPITGESLPAEKQAGDEVYASSINGEGLLEVISTRGADDSVLARILRMVEESAARRAPCESGGSRQPVYDRPAYRAHPCRRCEPSV